MSAGNTMDLKSLRQKIDDIDDIITAAYLERTRLVKQVGDFKRDNNLQIEQSGREEQLLARLTDRFGNENESKIKFLYDSIMTYSKLIQSQTAAESAAAHIPKGASFNEQFPEGAAVACQGAPGAYSQSAAEQLFKSPKLAFYPTFASVMDAVKSGAAAAGILPLENSTAGSVNEVYDLLSDGGLYVAGAKKCRVKHALLAKQGADRKQLKSVTSHPQALSQCARFIEKSGLVPVAARNTAEAAKSVAEGDDMFAAAIASAEAAALYELKVLQHGIQDADYNYTRFVAVSKVPVSDAGAQKVSLLVHMPHKPGSLYRLMSIAAAYGANLTKLESRPIPGTDFEFGFYIDIDGVQDEQTLGRLLAAIDVFSTKWVYLGKYREY